MFNFSPLEQFDTIVIAPLHYSNVLDLSFASILIPLCLGINFVLFFVLFFIKNMKVVPLSWQLFWEVLFIFITDLMLQQIGVMGLTFFAFVFTIFCFVLSCNLISLLPFGIALTSHIIMIFFLSIGLGVSLSIIGIARHGLKFLQFFIPDCPFALLFLLIFLEIFSYVLRFFSLAIRLCANIMAGHTLVHIITTAVMNTILMETFVAKIVFFSISAILLLAVLSLEFGVACLQAYVFSILVCIYFADVIKEPSH